LLFQNEAWALLGYFFSIYKVVTAIAQKKPLRAAFQDSGFASSPGKNQRFRNIQAICARYSSKGDMMAKEKRT
jgi:hypothetical protein